MKIKKLKELFDLANELYIEETEKSGDSILPFCWAENEHTGELVIYSFFGKDS